MSGRMKWAITLLMAGTFFRVQTIMFLGEVERFGGPAPDAWLAPWFSDAVLGLMLPVMLWLFWTRRSAATWGILVAYNAVGAFDYATGLATQWLSPMPPEMASSTTVYLGIGVFMACQLVVLGLLFRRSTIADFIKGKTEE